VIDDAPKLVLAAAMATLALLALWAVLDRRSTPAARVRAAWRTPAFRRGVVSIVIILTIGAIAEDVLEAEHDEWILQVDARIITAVAAPPPALRHAAALVSRLTGEGLAVLLAAAIPALVLRRRGRDALLLASAAVGAWATSGLFKILFLVPRPRAHDLLRVTASYGFPSGHTLVTLVTFGTLAWLLRPRHRPTRVLLMVAAWTIGLAAGASRVVLNAHWPSDVVAALALGALWLVVLPAITEEPRWRSRPQSAEAVAPAH
jgi:membrane-associated phospholipid phosphatase